MPAPYAGQCICGDTRYRVNEEPLTLYACHCTDCQKRSGSAFGLSMWVRRASIEVTAGEAVLQVHVLEGRRRLGRVCARCGTRLWSEMDERPEYAVVRPGTLDDAGALEPVAHIWMRSARPWVRLPEGAPRYDTQPADYGELFALWRDRGGKPGSTPTA